jgi:hypothetical protein
VSAPKHRRTLRETLQATQDSLDMYAALSGRERVIVGMPAAPKPRAPAKPSTEPTESQIQRAVLQYLKHHPRVALVYRVNSGTFTAANRDGSTRYIRANTQRGMPDLCGTLKDGRAIYVEVKSKRGKVQPHQQEFLDRASAAGALAGVVRSIEDAQRLMGDIQ